MPMNKSFWLWLGILIALTGGGVLWLWLDGINPAVDFSPAIIVIAYSASLAAIIASAVYGGWKAVRELLGQIVRWRFALRWYVVAVLLPIAIVGVAHLIYWLLGGRVTGPLLDVSALSVGMGAIIAGSLGEEIGWRGFAQPLLQKRLSIFWASCIVGLIWATWHCWIVLAPGGFDGTWLLDVSMTYVRLVATAVIYGWLYNVTGRSLLVVMLAHAAHNVVLTCVPVTNAHIAVLVAVLYGVAAVAISWSARHELFRYQ